MAGINSTVDMDLYFVSFEEDEPDVPDGPEPEPTEEPVEGPAEDPSEEPTGEPTEEPVEEPGGEPETPQVVSLKTGKR